MNEPVKSQPCPGPCGSVRWRVGPGIKGLRFDTQSGHMPGLRFQPRSCTYGRQHNFSLSVESIKCVLGWELKKKEKEKKPAMITTGKDQDVNKRLKKKELYAGSVFSYLHLPTAFRYHMSMVLMLPILLARIRE